MRYFSLRPLSAARLLGSSMLLAQCAACVAEPVTLSAFVALSRPLPQETIPFGPAQSQAIDVFLPSGPGPFPVAVLIHGGCWSQRTAGREQLRHLGPELARAGIATWSIGYRRMDEAGGGYPGTYQDVAFAIDSLRAAAPRLRFDLARTLLVGHSAGGHLALWAAARAAIPASSPLYRPDALIIPKVISLAGVGDLASFGKFVAPICGPGVVEPLLGTPASPVPLAEVSPVAMTAPRGRMVLVSGILDRLVPPYVGHEFVAAMRGRPELQVLHEQIPDAGHFDLVTPGTPAWTSVSKRIQAELGAPAPNGAAGPNHRCTSQGC